LIVKLIGKSIGYQFLCKKVEGNSTYWDLGVDFFLVKDEGLEKVLSDGLWSGPLSHGSRIGSIL
jgi:hypothetical protein